MIPTYTVTIDNIIKYKSDSIETNLNFLHGKIHSIRYDSNENKFVCYLQFK